MKNRFILVLVSVFLTSYFYFAEECGKCRAGSKRLNLEKFCTRDYGKYRYLFVYSFIDNKPICALYEYITYTAGTFFNMALVTLQQTGHLGSFPLGKLKTKLG